MLKLRTVSYKYTLFKTLFSNGVYFLIMLAAISYPLFATKKISFALSTPYINLGNTVAGDYLAARFASNQYDLDDAANYYLKILEHAPNDPDLLEHSFKAVTLAGNMPQAVALAKRYVKHKPNALNAHLVLAIAEAKQGNYAGVEREIRSVKLQNRRYFSTAQYIFTPIILAWAKFGQDEYEQAYNVLRNLDTSAKKGFSHILHHQALMYDLEGKKELAEQAYKTNLTMEAQPYNFIRNAGNFFARHNQTDVVSKIYHDFKQNEDSETLFSLGLKQLDFTPNIPNRPNVQNALHGIMEVLLDATNLSYQLGLHQEALAYLHMLLYLDPQHNQGNLLLAMHYDMLEKYDKANMVYRRILENENFYYQARVSIARNLYHMGQKDIAKKQLEQIFKQYPDYYKAGIMLGNLHSTDKNYTSASRVYEAAISRLGDLKQEHWPYLYAFAINLDRSGYWDKAEKQLFKALELKPNQPDILNYIGYTWLVMDKNIPEAKTMIEKAIKSRPNDAQIIDSMGWAFFKMFEFDAAVNYLEEAIVLMPYDPTLNDHLGDIYWKVGRKNEARFQWNRALQYNPEEKDIALIERKLKYGLVD